MTKKSIRFFDDREVRVIWYEGNFKWWYSVLDIVCFFSFVFHRFQFGDNNQAISSEVNSTKVVLSNELL